MNRRQLFLSTAKAALLTALGGLGLTSGAKAQPAPEAGATAGLARRQLNGLIGKITGTPGTPTATLATSCRRRPQRRAVEALLADARRSAEGRARS
jgi:hypothetical protein